MPKYWKRIISQDKAAKNVCTSIKKSQNAEVLQTKRIGHQTIKAKDILLHPLQKYITRPYQNVNGRS